MDQAPGPTTGQEDIARLVEIIPTGKQNKIGSAQIANLLGIKQSLVPFLVLAAREAGYTIASRQAQGWKNYQQARARTYSTN